MIALRVLGITETEQFSVLAQSGAGKRAGSHRWRRGSGRRSPCGASLSGRKRSALIVTGYCIQSTAQAGAQARAPGCPAEKNVKADHSQQSSVPLRLRRREFLKTSAAAAGSLSLGRLFANPLAAAAQQTGHSIGNPAEASRLRAVRPLIGTGWRGHIFPGAVAPFGLVQLSPDTAGGPEPQWNIQGDWYGWDHCSGYHYPDNIVLGFSHTHLQGTGGGDLGDLLLMPVVEGRNWSWEPGRAQPVAEMQTTEIGPDSGWVFSDSEKGYRSYFSHENESARAGFYSVHLLTPGVHAELTATARCGMHRYRFPAGQATGRQGVIIDLVHSIGSKLYEGKLNFESPARISGSRATHGWAADRQCYFVMEFSRPARSLELNIDGTESQAAPGGAYSGKAVKAIYAFEPGDAPLVIRVGISGTSIEGARKNLAAEIPGWDFDAVARSTGEAWERELAVVNAELGSAAANETFYTGMYHSLVAPATFNDVDGTYRGQDRRNHSDPGFTKYTTLSIWDIYRGEFPFLTIAQPGRVNDIVRTMLADYEQLDQRVLPHWPLWGNETWSMTGFHAAGMIVAAYVRGFRGFDAEAAYKAIRETAFTTAESHGNGQLQELFRKYGYVPMDLRNGSVSCTLDFAYDYWCAGAMAQLLGKRGDAEMFFRLGQNYRNVYDAATGFMRGKTQDGRWRDPFRPDQEYDDYVETDAWQASFSVPHDVAGLIALHGGDDAFIARLDALFTSPSYVVDARPDVTGMVGQDAQGNEPSNHHAYLYSFAGAPWKTQYWVRKVAGLYSNTPAGIPGNDDCGQLSSWYVFAALGFYPVNAANGVYVIGSPIVKRAVIRNPVNGAKFAIVAENNSAENVYIQSAKLNGKDLARCWLSHAEIAAGGELVFRMGSKPDKEWATGEADRPPSGLIP
jgi:predicted alpha-1,2-mannosidase